MHIFPNPVPWLIRSKMKWVTLFIYNHLLSKHTDTKLKEPYRLQTMMNKWGILKARYQARFIVRLPPFHFTAIIYSTKPREKKQRPAGSQV